MSLSSITIRMTADLRAFNAALDSTRAALDGWAALVWWDMWGTNGWKRQTALVPWSKQP